MYAQAGRPNAAYREYLKAAKSGIDDPYIWFRIGALALRMGDIERSAQAFGRAIKDAAPPVGWLRQTATVQGMAGMPRDALDTYGRILRLAPGDQHASLAAAKLLLGFGKSDSAAVLLEKMVPRWPENISAAREKAQLLLNAHRPDLVVEWCRSHPQCRSDRRAAHLCALAMEATGAADSAAATYVSLAGNAGCSEQLLTSCFQGLVRLGRSDDAYMVAKAASRCEGLEEEWGRRAVLILLGSNQLAKAEEELEQTLRKAPDDLFALDLLSMVDIQTNRLGRAHSLLSRAVQLDPRSGPLRRKSAALLADMGDDRGALLLLSRCVEEVMDTTCALALASAWTAVGFPERGVEITSTFSSSNNEVLFQRAASWERLACVGRSRELFELLLEQEPAHDSACNYLGYMLAERGLELSYAKWLIESALAAEPKNPYYLDSLAWVFYMEGRVDEALPLLEHALDVAGDEPELLKHLGEVLVQLGRTEEGLVYLEKGLRLAPWDASLRLRIRELTGP